MRVAISILAPLWCQVALAQVTWPEWNPPLGPAPSKSPVRAEFPADVSIMSPDPSLAANRARWLGRWKGWACLDAACETKMAVEKVTAEAASLVYVFASASVKPNPQRLEAKFVGEELHGTLASGSRVAYRIRADGNMEFLFMPRAGNVVGGLLSKE